MTRVLRSFLDEMEKIALQRIAKSKKARELMLEAIERRGWSSTGMTPHGKHPIDLKRAFRSTSRESRGSELPIKERLKNYRKWKKSETGELPEIERPGTMVDGRWREKAPRVSDTRGSDVYHTRSSELVPVQTGGTAEGLAAAQSEFGSRAGREFLVPGQTKTSVRGMWLHPQGQLDDRVRDYAVSRAGGDIAHRGGTPAVGKAKIKKKNLVHIGGGSGTELMAPEQVFAMNRPRLDVTPIAPNNRAEMLKQYGPLPKHPLPVAETSGPMSKYHYDRYERAQGLVRAGKATPRELGLTVK